MHLLAINEARMIPCLLWATFAASSILFWFLFVNFTRSMSYVFVAI
jgi:hypothetical protein